MKRNDITSNYIDLEHKAKGDEENDNGETKKQDLDGNIRNKATVVQKQPNRSKVKKRVGVSAIAQQQENTQQLINLGLRGVAQQLSMARFIQNTPVNTIPQWQLDMERLLGANGYARRLQNTRVNTIPQWQLDMERLLGANGYARRLQNTRVNTIPQWQLDMERLLGANGYARHIQNSPLNAISHKQQRMDKLLSLSGNGLSEIVNNIDRWTSLRDNWSFSLTEEEEDKVRDALATLPEPYKLKIDENDEHEKSCLIESIESKVSIPLEDVPSTLGVIDVVSDITSDDIFSFYNHLVKYPMLGLEHEVGKRILEQIEHSKRFTATDLTIYRARERKRELPFSDVEMFEAPFGLAGHGRYNVWGHGELYTCDNKETAIEELKVSSASCVDVVTWRLQTPLDVLDLVEVDSPLVRYCSYTKQTATNLEYLVPNFLSQCAKFVGIHGIRFRSNMNNQVINYVFFDFEHRYFKTVNLERNYITLE